MTPDLIPDSNSEWLERTLMLAGVALFFTALLIAGPLSGMLGVIDDPDESALEMGGEADETSNTSTMDAADSSADTSGDDDSSDGQQTAGASGDDGSSSDSDAEGDDAEEHEEEEEEDDDDEDDDDDDDGPGNGKAKGHDKK